MKGAWVTWAQIGIGQLIYALYVPNHTAPIGFVWGHSQGEQFCTSGSFVQPWARRFGVRSRINNEIFTHFAVITTVSGSKEGGKQFLKASGYRWSKPMRCFYLERPQQSRS